MSEPTNGDRVTNKTLYEELGKLRDEIPSRLEIRLTVTIGALAASGITTAITHLSPPAQVAAMARLAYSLFS